MGYGSAFVDDEGQGILSVVEVGRINVSLVDKVGDHLPQRVGLTECLADGEHDLDPDVLFDRLRQEDFL